MWFDYRQKVFLNFLIYTQISHVFIIQILKIQLGYIISNIENVRAMEFETNKGKTYQVEEFYRRFKTCLPKIAMIDRGIRGNSEKDTLDPGEVIVVVSKTHGDQIPKHSTKHGSSEFVEVYRLDDGEVGETPVYLPLNMRELHIVEVVGIKNRGREEWKELQQYVACHLTGTDSTADENKGGNEYETFVNVPQKKPKAKTNLITRTYEQIRKISRYKESTSVNQTSDDSLTYEGLSPSVSNALPSFDMSESVKTIQLQTDIDENETPISVNKKAMRTRNHKPGGVMSDNTTEPVSGTSSFPPERPKPPVAAKPKSSTRTSFLNPPPVVDMIKELDAALKQGNRPNMDKKLYVNDIGRVTVRPFMKDSTVSATNLPIQNQEAYKRSDYEDKGDQNADKCYLNIYKVKRGQYYENENSAGGKSDDPYINNAAGKDPEHDRGTSQYQPITSSYITPTYTSDYDTLPKSQPQKEKQMHNDGSLAPEQVQALTIEEVGLYLESLKLNKYVGAFEENQIDGALLASLEEDILVTEFQMKRFEARKLLNFAKEGRLPLSRKPLQP